MSKIHFRAEIQNMGKKDILDMIAPETLARLKKTDPQPIIKVFAVGHEGEAQGNMIGKGLQVLKYVKDVIIQLFQKIRVGLQIFHNHAETNLHAGRELIGEVVGKSLQMIGGKLHSLAAVYVFPKHRDLPLDVASIEANITYDDKREVLSVDDVSGIALGDSRENKPGVPNAKLLGALQAFTKKSEVVMSIKEVREAIQEGKFTIGDLFSDEEIKELAAIKDLEKKHADEQAHAKRVEKKYGEERDAHLNTQKEMDKIRAENKTLSETSNKLAVGSLFDKSLEKRKLGEKEQAFIKKTLDKFASDKKGDELAREFETFMDKQIDEFSEMKKLLVGEGSKGKEGGEGSGDGKGAGDDLENPKNNDFIPE